MWFRSISYKNKIREITPEPSAPNFCLDYKKKIKVNYNLEKYSRQNSKKRIKLYQNVEEELKKTLKEKEELQKEIENYKLRETGYIKKIEELAFALNNLITKLLFFLILLPLVLLFFDEIISFPNF